MSLFDDIRQGAAWAKDLSDDEIIRKGSELTGLPAFEIAKGLGVDTSKRGIFGAANDYAIEVANAAAGLPKAALDLVSPGSDASGAIGRFISEGEQKQSYATQEAKAKLNQAMQAEGTMDQIKGAGQYVLENPVLAASQAIGSFVGPGAAIKLGRGVGAMLGASEKVAGRLALGAGSATSGVLAGGDAAGDAYEMVMNAPSLQHLPINERERMATTAAREASVVPFALGAAAGLFGAEKALATGTKSLLKTGAQEFVGEAIEEGGTKLSANVAAGQYAPEIRAMQGVAGSATLGGLLGGGTGVAVGAMTKQPDSLLQGSTNISTGYEAPDSNAINKAIDANSTEIATDTDLQLNEIRQQQAQLEQARVQAKQESDAIAAQQAQEQAQVQQQQAQEAFTSVAQTYGVQPLEVANQFNVGGKRLFSIPQATQFLAEIDKLNEGKSEEQKALIGSALASGAIKVPQTANTKAVNNAAVKFLDSWGFGDAQTKLEAAQRAETLISTLEGPKALKEADQLNSFFKSITGTDAPAFVSLQQAAQQQPNLTKGASNEQLQLQNNAGLRAVSEQSGTTQASGNQPGDVRSTGVQSIQSGSVGAGSLGLQTGAIPSGGVPTSTSADGSRTTVSGQVSGSQEAQVIPDERVEAINVVEQIAERAFGARDYKIIMRFIQSDAALNQADIAREFDISRQRVNQIVGAAKGDESFGEQIERRARESWGPKFLYSARAMGMSEAEVRGLFEAIQATQEETSLTAQQQQAKALSEGTTEDTLLGKEATESDLESEEARTLGMEETADTEKGAAGYRVFTPGVSGETGIEGASATNRAKFSKKELRNMSDDQLQNLAADEDTTPERLDDIVEELIRRQDVRASKGEPSAVQKPSPKSVPVRKQSESSEGVRKQDAEERQAATESKAEEDLGKTEEELAAAAWDKGIKEFPEAPKFADLTEEQQSDWISFGEENWTPEDVQTELVKLAKKEAAGIVINKNISKQQGKNIATAEQNEFLASLNYSEALPDVDANGNPVSLAVAVTTLEDLQSKFPGVARAVAAVSSTHEHLFDAITNVGVVDSYDFNAAIVTEVKADGRVLNWLMLTKKALETTVPGAQAFTVIHETGHVADMAGNGGAYSNSTELSVRKKGKDFIMQGAAIKELFAFYEKNKDQDNDLATLLSYPFEDMATMEAKEFQQEVFAQLWASYYNTALSAQLESGAPSAYKFIEEAYNHAEEKRSVAPTTATATRTKAAIIEATFKNRYKGSGVQGSSQLYGQPAQQVTVVRKSKTLDKAREEAAKRVAKLPKPIRGPLQHVADTIAELAKKGLPYFAFTEDLADIAVKYLPSVKKYIALSNERKAIRIKFDLRVDEILQKYDALPSEVKGTGDNSVNKFLMDSTRESKWAYNPGWIKGFNEETDIDVGLEARFKALPDSAQALVKEVFAHGQSTLLAMQKAVTENINTEYDALIAAAKKSGDTKEEAELTKKKASTLTEYATLMRTNSKKPYAPLKRFGNYVIVGKSQQYIDNEAIVESKTAAPDEVAEARKKLRELEKNDLHYFVQFAETVGEAKAIVREEAGNYDYLENFEKDSSQGYGVRDLNAVFSRLRNMVEDEKDSSLSDASDKAINRLLADLKLTLLSETSARQSERRRKNIGGAEKDMMRAFATQGRATANFISSLENSGAIYDTLRAMKDEARKGTEGSRADRSRYYNEFMKRHFMGMDYQPSPFIDKALSTTSTWMLLTNPAYFMQNILQPFMMSLPVIAANYGYARSTKEMFRAYTDIASVIRKHGLTEASYSKLPEDVRTVVEVLVNRGRIDISLEQDLGRWRSTEDSKFNKFGRATELLRSMAQDIETINRVVTAVASYRLAIKSPKGNPTMATNFADKIIYTTHGDYSGFNAPRITRSSLGRLATQFRKFQLIQISLMTRLFNDAFANEDPAVRMIGKKSLAFTVGHTAVMGGIMGLPGFYAIAALYGMLFGDDDEPDNPELALRRAIGDETIADLLVKGVPAALGVDLSGKLGMGQMLSALPYSDVNLSRKGVYETIGTIVSGPFGGLLAKSADGVSLMAGGDYQKGLEQLLPTGLANVAKAYRFGTEGVTNRAGDVVMNADDIGFVDQFFTALGLPTDVLTDRNFLNAAKFEYDQFYNDKASEIKRTYTRAYKEGDTASLNEAREAWKSLQESRAQNGYQRQPLSTLLKAPQEQKKRERQSVGGVQFNKANRGFVRTTSEL